MGLIVFGGGPLQKWIKWKTKDVKNLKLMGFTSNREQLSNIMASSDYFVHGSAAETFGIVVAEVICSGLPIVVPKTRGAAEFSNPLFSEVYKTDNSQSLAKISSRDRYELTKHCKKASASSVRTVDEHFDQLFLFYQNLVDQKQS